MPVFGKAFGTGAGTSPSGSVVGSDIGGQISVTTGTAPAPSSPILTITLASAILPAFYMVNLIPANANAAALTGASQVYMSISSGTLVLTSGATALTAATTYLWNYEVIYPVTTGSV